MGVAAKGTAGRERLREGLEAQEAQEALEGPDLIRQGNVHGGRRKGRYWCEESGIGGEVTSMAVIEYAK